MATLLQNILNRFLHDMGLIDQYITGPPAPPAAEVNYLLELRQQLQEQAEELDKKIKSL